MYPCPQVNNRPGKINSSKIKDLPNKSQTHVQFEQDKN